MTTPTPDHPPLWRVMRQAYDQAPPAPLDAADNWTDRHGYAAEILAVRDYLFPGGRPDPVGVSPDCPAIWDELTAEAERAERGDG